MKWIEALKQYNSGKGMWCIPKKGTTEYFEVRALMNSDASVAKQAPKKSMEDINMERREKSVAQLREATKHMKPGVRKDDYEAMNAERRSKSIAQLREATKHMKPGVRVDIPIKPKPSSKREFEDEYQESVADLRRRQKSLKEYKATIALAARDPYNQLARMMNSAHIDEDIATEEPETYESFHSRKMKELAAKAAREAAKPDRYKMLLAKAIRKVEARKAGALKNEYPGRTNSRTGAHEPGSSVKAVLIDIPAKANAKDLTQLIKENHMKGFSGKSVGALREMLENVNEERKKREVRDIEELHERAKEQETDLKRMMELHNTPLDKLETMLGESRGRHEEAQRTTNERIASIKSAIRNKSISVDEANRRVRESNEIVSAFNKANKKIDMMLQDAIKFHKTGTSPILEGIAETVDDAEIYFGANRFGN